jgi:DNA-binding response OmpR family regulator
MAAQRTTILCIDDDERALLLRAQVLERNGYHVLCATNPDDGFRLLASESVAAIILDYYLGPITGSVVAFELHRRAAHIPVLLLSSAVYLPDDARGLVDAFCAKIDGPIVLLDSLKHLLDRPAASQND